MTFQEIIDGFAKIGALAWIILHESKDNIQQDEKNDWLKTTILTRFTPNDRDDRSASQL